MKNASGIKGKLIGIIRLPIMIRYGYYLEFGKADKLVLECKKRLKKNDKDFIALFYSMYGFSYQKHFDLAKQYFYRMLKIKNLSYKTRRYFIVAVIGSEIKEKKYDEVIRDCEKLLVTEKNLQLKKLLKRLLCEANYYKRHFNKVIDLCKTMKYDFSDDIELLNFVKAYEEAIMKEKRK